MEHILFNTQKIKRILEKLNLRPKDYLGQNFLIDNDVASRIVNAADISKEDTVLEVGPGLGVLTQELALRAGRVIAVEKDEKFSKYLKGRFRTSAVEIITDDILYFYKKFPSGKVTAYKIVANLPYNISARFLKIFLSMVTVKPTIIVVSLQKEVARKLVSRPGSLTKLGILAQVYAKPEILFTIPPFYFYPTPQVDSSVVKLTVKQKSSFIFPHHEIIFWRLVRIGFSAKRKKLANNLANGLHIPPVRAKEMLNLANLKENIRAQELSLADWLTLVDIVESFY